MLNLPFWQVNGRIYTNKLSAMMAGKSLGKQVHFNLYDDVFLDVDWSHRDTESFQSMLHRRCKQIRESFRYIRLFYSGGHDSHTMLLAFLESGTHIDEIVMSVNAQWVSKNRLVFDDFTKKHAGNIEVFNAAIPFVKKIASSIPKTKVTIESYTGDYLLSGDDLSKTLTANVVDVTVDKVMHRKILYGEEKITGAVNLVGAEKPRLKKDEGRFFWIYYDNALNGVSTHDTGTEMFYITPQMPELHRKQCHMMMDWIKKYFPDHDDVLNLVNHPNDLIRKKLNDYIRYPLWHQESNRGWGKKIMSTNDPLAKIADAEKTLQIIKMPGVKHAMDKIQDQHRDFINKDVPYWFEPCPSYMYYIGK